MNGRHTMHPFPKRRHAGRDTRAEGTETSPWVPDMFVGLVGQGAARARACGMATRAGLRTVSSVRSISWDMPIGGPCEVSPTQQGCFVGTVSDRPSSFGLLAWGLYRAQGRMRLPVSLHGDRLQRTSMEV